MIRLISRHNYVHAYAHLVFCLKIIFLQFHKQNKPGNEQVLQHNKGLKHNKGEKLTELSSAEEAGEIDRFRWANKHENVDWQQIKR